MASNQEAPIAGKLPGQQCGRQKQQVPTRGAVVLAAEGGLMLVCDVCNGCVGGEWGELEECGE